MNRRKLILGMLGLILLAGIPAAVWYAYQDSDETRIRKAVTEGRVSIESEDLEGAMDHVSEKYEDERGWTYYVVKRILRDAFSQFEGFKIEMGTMQIEIREKEAAASFDLRLFVNLQGQRGLLVGSVQEPAHIQLFLTKGLRRWLVTDVKGVRSPYGEL